MLVLGWELELAEAMEEGLAWEWVQELEQEKVWGLELELALG